MSEKYNSFTCVFDSGDNAAWWYGVFDHLESDDPALFDGALIDRGYKAVFKRIEDPGLSYVHLSDNVLSFEVMTHSDEAIPSSFVKDLAFSGASIIVRDVSDDGCGSRISYFIKGNKATKKDIKEYLSSVGRDVRFIIASTACPEILPACVVECGGYEALVFGKPILFHVCEESSRFEAVLDDCLEVADLSCRNPMTGDNIVQCLVKCKPPSYTGELVEVLLRRGVDGVTPDKYGRKPMFWSLENGAGYSQFIECGGENPNAVDVDGLAVIHKLALNEYIDEDYCDLWVKQGVDLNYLSPLGTVAWIAQKTNPAIVSELVARGGLSQSGSDTYNGSLRHDIVVAIEHQDSDTFMRLLPFAKGEIDFVDLLRPILKCAFLLGFNEVQRVFQADVTVGYSVEVEGRDEELSTMLAISWVLLNISKARIVEDHMAIAEAIIRSSSPVECNKFSSGISTRRFWEAPELFLKLFVVLAEAGIEIQDVVVDFSNGFSGSEYRYAYVELEGLVNNLLDVGVSISGFDWQWEMAGKIPALASTMPRVMQNGLAPDQLSIFFRNNYNKDRNGLLKFLLEARLDNGGVWPVIWKCFLRVGNELDEGFITALVLKGLPVNAAYFSSSWLKPLTYYAKEHGYVLDDEDDDRAYKLLTQLGMDFDKCKLCEEHARKNMLSHYAEVKLAM
jgi:hypothetical protein